MSMQYSDTHAGVPVSVAAPGAVFGTLRPVIVWLAVMFLFAALGQASAAELGRVRSVSHSVDGPDEKVTIALSARAAFKVNVLDRNPSVGMPWRLYVDIGNTAFSPGVNRNIRPQDACVRAVRSALNDPRTVRVVLEFNYAPAAGDYTVVQHDSPPSLDIIVHAEKIRVRLGESPVPSVSEPLAQPSARQEPPAAPAPPAVEAQPPRQPSGQAAAREKQAQAAGPRTYVIAIDAGHGGRDPGALGHGGLKEKHICLAIALELKKTLDRKAGYTTLMTRTSDSFVSLPDRARIAAEGRADLLISIHGNSHVDARVDGIETYYLNFSSDAEARRVAARENFTTPEQIGDLEMILFDLIQGEKTNISSLLAGHVHNRLTAAVTGRYKKMRNLGVKHAPMRVLIDAEMPGILFEAGFISNPEEVKRLQTPAHQQLLAEAIADGIHDFFTSSKTAAYRHP